MLYALLSVEKWRSIAARRPSLALASKRKVSDSCVAYPERQKRRHEERMGYINVNIERVERILRIARTERRGREMRGNPWSASKRQVRRRWLFGGGRQGTVGERRNVPCRMVLRRDGEGTARRRKRERLRLLSRLEAFRKGEFRGSAAAPQ